MAAELSYFAAKGAYATTVGCFVQNHHGVHTPPVGVSKLLLRILKKSERQSGYSFSKEGSLSRQSVI